MAAVGERLSVLERLSLFYCGRNLVVRKEGAEGQPFTGEATPMPVTLQINTASLCGKDLRTFPRHPALDGSTVNRCKLEGS